MRLDPWLADTFYYGRGAGPHPTGVAVVSDLMRVAREIRSGCPQRVSPFAHKRLEIEANGFKLLWKKDHIPESQYMLAFEKK